MARYDKFKGSNKLKSARFFFNERARYQTQAYREFGGLGPHVVKNTMFAEMQYYGIIDAKGDSIIPQDEFMKPLKKTRKRAQDYFIFDFVADMFKDTKENIQNACAASMLPQLNPFIVNMDPVQAYKSPRQDYEKYLRKILTHFNKTIIPTEYGIINITNYDQYVKAFFDHMEKNSINKPITFSRWCRSWRASIFHTGLAIDITGFDPAEDKDKIKEFIDDPMFSYYKKILINRGFSVVHHTPWIIIADLQSPAIKRYMESYQFRNLQDLINKRHTYTNTLDIDIIYNHLRRYYNYMVIERPFSKKVDFLNWENTKKCGKNTYSTILRRLPASADHFRISYPTEKRFMQYIDLRNIEEGMPLKPGRIRQTKKYTKKLLKLLDTEEALGYINNTYRDETWSKDFGFRDLISRQKIQNQDTIETTGILTTPEGETALSRSGGTSGGISGY